ncbi:MAG: hypothetical protein LBJ64_05465 [Deltaproteobacteria bacterium]|jgi:hypothetical protein|nr:hypothetical protein [Deltaproteobacteria bacterium]
MSSDKLPEFRRESLTSDLPEFYRGYLTSDLVEVMYKIAEGLKEPLPIPKEMVLAVRMLAREYRLTAEAQVSDILFPNKPWLKQE